MAECPFGVPWSDLTLEAVQAFFGEADPATEPLTWEAKGQEMIRPERVRREVVGFANQLGGFLVLGVSNPGDRWVVDGVEFRGGEPETWLDQVARAGVSPVPEIEPKSWSVGDGRHVAVLRVEPVAVPPCIWDGRVFQRVSGRSDPVTDQRVLLDLAKRGEAAVERAKEAAARGAGRLASDPGPREGPGFGMALALASVPPVADATARVFRRSWEVIVCDLLRGLADIPPGLGLPPGALTGGHRRDMSWVQIGGFGFNGVAWTAESHSDGTIVVGWNRSDEYVSISEAAGDYSLGRMWRLAYALVTRLGALPPAFLAIVTSGEGKGRTCLGPTSRPIVRELSSWDAPSQEQIEGIGRELVREQQIIAHEPEPASGGSEDD